MGIGGRPSRMTPSAWKSINIIPADPCIPSPPPWSRSPEPAPEMNAFDSGPENEGKTIRNLFFFVFFSSIWMIKHKNLHYKNHRATYLSGVISPLRTSRKGKKGKKSYT